MPGLEIFISEENAEIVGLALDAVAERMENLTPAFEEIFVDMLLTTDTQIKSQGRRGGGSWAALKPDTVRKKGGDTRILYTEGAPPKYSEPGGDALVKSVTKAEAPYQVFQMTNESLIFGTSLDYGQTIQKGSSRRNIPARPFLKVLQGDVDRWTSLITRRFMAPLHESKARA